jgi:hypothetical protein
LTRTKYILPLIGNNGASDFNVYKEVDRVVRKRLVKDKKLVGRIIHTRDDSGVSKATYIDKAEVLKYATADAARVSWFDGNPFLLIEEQRENILLHSGDFLDVVWSGFKINAPIADTTGPDGISNSAWSVTDNDALFIGDLSQNIPVIADTSRYIFSVFIKKESSDTGWFPGVGFFTDDSAEYFVNVDTVDGILADVVGAEPIFSAIEDYGTYWRVSVGGDNDNSEAVYPSLRPSINSGKKDLLESVSNGPEGTTVFYGPQLEKANYPSSYIGHTEAVTLTRNADDLDFTDMDVLAVKRGTIYFETWVAGEEDGDTFLSNGVTPSVGNGGLQIRTTSNSFSTQVGADSGTSAATSSTITSRTKHKCAVVYDDQKTRIQSWIDGIGGSDVVDSLTLVKTGSLNIGSHLGANVMTGGLKTIKIYQELLGDWELSKLTT